MSSDDHSDTMGAVNHRNKYYILKGRHVVRAASFIVWAKFFETADRVIKQDTVGKVFISTVFLGIDHNFFGEGPPLIFETMIFGLGDEYQERCSTYEEAEAMHQRAVDMVRSTMAA